MVRILANPILLRAVLVFVCATSAFLLGLIFMRLLKRKITEESEGLETSTPSVETLPLHLYNTVIQQLKQQKHELQVQSQSEQQRARTSETLSQAVLRNLSSGVLVFGTNGLVKTSNPAAKRILGFASATGMGAEDIFRGAVVRRTKAQPSDLSVEDECVLVSDEIGAVLREGCRHREVEAEYETPAGERRVIAVTVSAIEAADGTLIGIACLINDRTEMDDIHRDRELQNEISAELALRLRTSLTTISGYAQQLASSRDPEMAKQLATDIAQEAVQLDCTIGGFLTKKKDITQSIAAHASGA